MSRHPHRSLLLDRFTRATLFGAGAAPIPPGVARFVRGRAMSASAERVAAPDSDVPPTPAPSTQRVYQMVMDELRKGPATLSDLEDAIAPRASRKAISMSLLRLQRSGMVRTWSVGKGATGRPAAVFAVRQEGREHA